MNRDDYVAEGIKQLGDARFYKKLHTDPTEDINYRINCFIQGMRAKGEISKSLEAKLLTTEARTPELYLLPKIHKKQRPPRADQWSQPMAAPRKRYQP